MAAKSVMFGLVPGLEKHHSLNAAKKRKEIK